MFKSLLNFGLPFFGMVFAPDGEAGGGSGGGASDGGASGGGSADAGAGAQGGEKGGAGDGGAPKVKTHDEKGRAYADLYKETTERFKDVDLERWAKLKDVDLDELNQLKELASVLGDDALYQDVMKLVTEFKAGRYKPKGDGTTRDPRTDKALKDIEALKKERADEKKAREAREAEDAVKAFDKEVETSINAALKDSPLKSLTKRERNTVQGFIEQKFITDAESGTPKLTYKDLPKILEEALKEIENDRAEILSTSVKKDRTPESINGDRSGGAQRGATTPKSKRERVAAAAAELRSKL